MYIYHLRYLFNNYLTISLPVYYSALRIFIYISIYYRGLTAILFRDAVSCIFPKIASDLRYLLLPNYENYVPDSYVSI
jgi:hypothetical protein